MIKKAFAAILCLIMLCSCAQNMPDSSSSAIPSSDYPAAAFDITIDKCPQKVVSLIPQVTDIIVALGSDAQLAGISNNCDQIREAERVGTASLPDTAKIKELGADLVFTSSLTGSSELEILKNAGIKVAIVEFPAKYTGLISLYKQIAILISGNITGARNAANTFAKIDNKIKKLSNSSDYTVKAAIFVADGVCVMSDSLAAELAAFAGVTVCDVASAEAIICSEELSQAVSDKYVGKRVIVFDVGLLENRGANMYDTVATMEGAIKAK